MRFKYKIVLSILLVFLLSPVAYSGGWWWYNPWSGMDTDKVAVCTVYTSTGINASIDSLGTQAGVVILTEGVYDCNGTTAITIDYASTTIMGMGANTILSATTRQATPAVIDTNDKSWVTISNLSIKGEAGGGVTSNLIGDGDDADYLVVQNCWLYNSDARGINFAGENSLISGNYIENTDDLGMSASGQYSRVANNNIKLCTGGVKIPGSDITFSNNIIEDTASSTSLEVTGNRNILTTNICKGDGSTNRGIHLDNADNCVVSNNITSGHDVAGIQIDNDCTGTSLSGNICTDTIQYVNNGTLPVFDFQVSSNTVITTAPKFGNQLATDSSNIVYISSGTGAGAWIKIGGQ